MMTLKTPADTFGPFVTAHQEGASWICDGVVYPASVVGDAVLVPGAPEAPPTLAPPVPRQCSMYAARTVLYTAGLLELVEGIIANMPGEAGDLARIKWATALTVRRDDDLVTQVIPALGKTEAEIDAMFVAADLIDRQS
ncbi:hypothetical protein GJ698_15130 [Pseudoduganella sp. FT26W]|uniref:Uncharacterized protein n=1 Tax=Duganella aquatilis TaxID=2666082 RepID=A0A844CX95_9BURK|nr:hypothetical protein [Duganella aquatilis]MRW85417.1 hypothetical protein [Duganella aquatilis]